jgi:hypothetical protein
LAVTLDRQAISLRDSLASTLDCRLTKCRSSSCLVDTQHPLALDFALLLDILRVLVRTSLLVRLFPLCVDRMVGVRVDEGFVAADRGEVEARLLLRAGRR